MTEYGYSSADPTWSNAYLWPPLLKILHRHAPAPRRVFELGCGNGATARFLASNGYDVTGVDPSSSGIAIAKQFESDGLRFDVASTADDLGACFGRFPVVVSMEVIEHIPSSREYMRALESVLEPGGVAIISTPYHGYVKNLAVIATGHFDHHFNPLWEGGHLKFFTLAKLKELFDEFGFRDQQYHRVGRIPILAKSVIAVIRRTSRSSAPR